MTVDRLRKDIREKFGSYTTFATAISVDRYKLQQELLTPTKVEKEVIKKYSDLCNETDSPVLMTGKILRTLKTKIEEYGGFRKFCTESELISEPELYRVMRMDKVTPKMRDVLGFFEIEIGG